MMLLPLLLANHVHFPVLLLRSPPPLRRRNSTYLEFTTNGASLILIRVVFGVGGVVAAVVIGGTNIGVVVSGAAIIVALPGVLASTAGDTIPPMYTLDRLSMNHETRATHAHGCRVVVKAI